MNTNLDSLETALKHWRELHALLEECNSKIRVCQSSSYGIANERIFTLVSSISFEEDLSSIKKTAEKADAISSYLQDVIGELQVFETPSSTTLGSS